MTPLPQVAGRCEVGLGVPQVQVPRVPVLYCTVLCYTVLYCTVLQVLRLNTRGQLGLGERCVVPLQQRDRVELEVAVCEGVAGGWSYDERGLAMVFTVQYQEGEGEGWRQQRLCVQMQGLGGVLALVHCDPQDPRQRWRWEEYRPYWAAAS